MVSTSGPSMTARGCTLEKSASFSLIEGVRLHSVRQTRMSGWIPISRSSRTLCWVGLVFISRAALMYGT